MKPDFGTYLRTVAIEKEEHPEWRMGQTYYNVLRDMNPNLAIDFLGSDNDPFNDDNKIGEFLNIAYQEW